MAETPSKPEGNLDQLAERIRGLNERIIDLSKQAGEATLAGYARTLESIAQLEESAGKASPVELLTTFTTAQANFTRDLAESFTAAARRLGE